MSQTDHNAAVSLELLTLRYKAAAAELAAIEVLDRPTAGDEARADALAELCGYLADEITAHPLPTLDEKNAYARFCGWLLLEGGTVPWPEYAPLFQRLTELSAQETL